MKETGLSRITPALPPAQIRGARRSGVIRGHLRGKALLPPEALSIFDQRRIKLNLASTPGFPNPASPFHISGGRLLSRTRL